MMMMMMMMMSVRKRMKVCVDYGGAGAVFGYGEIENRVGAVFDNVTMNEDRDERRDEVKSKLMKREVEEKWRIWRIE